MKRLRCIHEYLLLTPLVITVLACQPDLPKITWEGEKIRFGTTEDELPCGKTLEALDQLVIDMEDDLQTFLPEGKKIIYYWLPGELSLSPCLSSAAGCADGTTVYSIHPIHTHELVHAVLSVLGKKHAFLEEGYAVAFSQESFSSQTYLLNVPLAMEESLSPNVDRFDLRTGMAGAFITYLIDEHGESATKEIYERSSRSTSFEQFKEIFSQTLEVPLEQTIVSFYNEVEPQYPANPPCRHTEITWATDTQLDYEIPLNCSNEDFIGPYYYSAAAEFEGFDFILRAQYKVEIPSTTTYEFTIIKEEDKRLMFGVRPCSSGYWLFDNELAIGDTHIEFIKELEADEYEIRIDYLYDADSNAELEPLQLSIANAEL